VSSFRRCSPASYNPTVKPDELREAYLAHFESRSHTRWPSDSLVPANDPTLLFTGAGMNQFKEMFLGVGNLPFKRAVTAQKCLRTGDLENVGKTYYHQTFFEMLGNFSFGDYFKREAIRWQWEFLTEAIDLPVDRLWVSVYEEDDEAFAIWRDEIGFPAERIWRLDAKSNYWPADAPEKGPNGPCGPCSEIFYDFGDPGAEGDPDAGRYCEIGNIVFTQFNRVGRHELEPLEQKNIDTGMGFERLLAVLNGVRSNFETGLFLPILHEIAAIADTSYRYDMPLGALYRRIADHVRAGVFLIADGVKPSNESRGYVARRILRRAVRDGFALGIDEPFLPRLVAPIVEIMGDAYPEVRQAQPAAEAFLRAEDEKFRETYHTGMHLLERALEDLAKTGSRTLSGETAFELYDSHGFPLELCEEICSERGIAVDRAGFDACMEQQRERARRASGMKGDVFQETAVTSIKQSVPASEFVGYDRTEAESEILALVSGSTTLERATAGDGELQVVARATPFYAEAGGQVGDTGVIETPQGRFEVVDTSKVESYWLHRGRVVEGALEKGAKAALRVDADRRAAITRNHSATHLLHAALRTVLGTHVTQAGSLVAPDRLRFDFTHPQAVRPDELEAIERWVQDEVARNAPVETQVMDLEEARAAGATALFGEKYDDRVRVVRIGEHSLELCGGIHVGASAEIGATLALQEAGVAAGVRRVEMVSGSGAFDFARDQRGLLRELAARLKAAPSALPDRVGGLLDEVRELRQREAARRRESGTAAAGDVAERAVSKGGVRIVVDAVETDDPKELLALSDGLRAKLGECLVVLAGTGGNKGVPLVATATDGAVEAGLKAGDALKALAGRLGGKGGGRPQVAQGRAPSADGLEQALEEVRAELAGA